MDKVGLALGGVVAYIVITLIIGWLASRRIKGLADYIIAGRRLGLALTYGTILATWFGTGLAMGGASMAYSYGYRGVIMDPIGAGLCIILFGLFFASELRKRGYMTISDFFRERYGSSMELLSAIIQVIAYMGWMGALMVTFGTVFKVFLGIPYEEGLIIGTVVTLAYTTLGGMWSVALTDLLQSILLMIGILVLLPFTIAAAGGLGVVGSKIPLDSFSILPKSNWGYLGYTGAFGAAFYISSWLVQGIGSLSCQDLVQRALSAKNERVSKYASILAGVTYVLLGLVPATIGIFGRLIVPNIDNPDEILPTLALKLLPTVPFIIFTVGLLAALMSSTDSAMLIPSTMIVNNILPKVKPDISERSKLLIARALVPVITFISLAIALYAKTIYFLMNLSWELILMVQGIPFILGLYWRRATKEGAIASVITNLIVWLGLMALVLPHCVAVEGDFEWGVWDAIYIAAPPAILTGFVAFVVTSLIKGRVK